MSIIRFRCKWALGSEGGTSTPVKVCTRSGDADNVCRLVWAASVVAEVMMELLTVCLPTAASSNTWKRRFSSLTEGELGYQQNNNAWRRNAGAHVNVWTREGVGAYSDAW